MFWPADPFANQEEAKSRWQQPWGAFGLLLLLSLSFLVSRWGLSQKTQDLARKKEEIQCFYLKNDFVTLPYSIHPELPPTLLSHHHRIQPILNEYYSDPTARRQAQDWLQESDLRGMASLAAEPDNPKEKQSCLDRAIQIGQLGRHPKRRIFAVLAGTQEGILQGKRDAVEEMIRSFFALKASHPFYGYGLIPSARQGSAIVTSLFVQPGWWTVFWMLLLIWLAGAMLEARWRHPGWLGWFVVSGLLGNLLFFFGMHRQTYLLLGAQTALAGLIGLWLVVSGLGKVRIVTEIPRLVPRREFAVPGFAIAGVWFVLNALDTLGFQRLPASVLAIQMLLFGLSAGIAYGLQYFGVWLIPESESQDKNFLESTWQVQKREQQKSAHQEQEILEKAKVAMDDARYREAVAFYRQAITSGFSSLQVLEGLLTACEKSGQAVRSEEYMRAIRAALFEKREERVAPLFHQYKRSGADASLTARDRLGLANDLRKARMFREAEKEADIVLEKGPDDPFYMKALLIRADSILDIGEDPEAALRILHQGEMCLERYPEYRTSLEKTRQRADRILSGEPEAAVSSAALQTLSVSSAALQTLSLPGIKSPGPKTSGALPTLSSSKTGAGLPTIQLPGVPAHLAQAPQDKLSLGEDLDFSLYDEFQSQPEQNNSWEDIPLLLLKEKGDQAGKDKSASMFAPSTKKETPVATDPDIALPKGDWWDDEDSRPMTAASPPRKSGAIAMEGLVGGSPFSAAEIASASRSSGGATKAIRESEMQPSSKPTPANVPAFDDFDSIPLPSSRPTPAKVPAFDDFDSIPTPPSRPTPAKVPAFDDFDSIPTPSSRPTPAKVPAFDAPPRAFAESPKEEEDVFESFPVESTEDPSSWGSDWGINDLPPAAQSPKNAPPPQADVFELTEIVEEEPLTPRGSLLQVTSPPPSLGSLLSSKAPLSSEPPVATSLLPMGRSLLTPSNTAPAPLAPSTPLTTRPLGSPSLLGSRLKTPSAASEDKNKPLVSQKWLERPTKKDDD